MRTVRQEMICRGAGPLMVARKPHPGGGPCAAKIAIEIHGEHGLRSTGFALEVLAYDADWNIATHQCPNRRPFGDPPRPK